MNPNYKTKYSLANSLRRLFYAIGWSPSITPPLLPPFHSCTSSTDDPLFFFLIFCLSDTHFPALSLSYRVMWIASVVSWLFSQSFCPFLPSQIHLQLSSLLSKEHATFFSTTTFPLLLVWNHPLIARNHAPKVNVLFNLRHYCFIHSYNHPREYVFFKKLLGPVFTYIKI